MENYDILQSAREEGQWCPVCGGYVLHRWLSVQAPEHDCEHDHADGPREYEEGEHPAEKWYRIPVAPGKYKRKAISVTDYIPGEDY